MPRATIREIASRAGVSVATVDRVLNGRMTVRDETASRVQQAARDLGYRAAPNWSEKASPIQTGFVLQRQTADFYRQFAADLEREATAAGVPTRIDFDDAVEPARIAARITALGAEVDALGVVAVDHPLVTDAIGALAARGVAVVSMLSELSAPGCRGHAGINNRAAGRTAGWAVERCARAPGPVGVLIGSHGYLGQEDREIGFRSYLRERAPRFSVLEPAVCLDDPALTERATHDLLRKVPGLVALYVAGGGEAGAIRALEHRQSDAAGPICICHELAPHTRSALVAGTVAVALAQDTRDIARRAVQMLAGLPTPTGSAPFRVHTPENL